NFFFVNAPATTNIYTLSLHDALPIYEKHKIMNDAGKPRPTLKPDATAPAIVKLLERFSEADIKPMQLLPFAHELNIKTKPYTIRSEEHTSELQSRENLVCRLLLEKKK